jgi:hypothetical protein
MRMQVVLAKAEADCLDANQTRPFNLTSESLKLWTLKP